VLLSSYGVCWMDYEIMKAVVSWRRGVMLIWTPISEDTFRNFTTPTMMTSQCGANKSVELIVQINTMHDLATTERRGWSHKFHKGAPSQLVIHIP